MVVTHSEIYISLLLNQPIFFALASTGEHACRKPRLGVFVAYLVTGKRLCCVKLLSHEICIAHAADMILDLRTEGLAGNRTRV